MSTKTIAKITKPHKRTARLPMLPPLARRHAATAAITPPVATPVVSPGITAGDGLVARVVPRT